MGKQKRKKVLIAEDQSSLRDALSGKLIQEGFDIIETSNGKECLEAVDSQDPDIILLDMIMPKINGITVLEELKKDREKSKIPVIVLTNLSSADDIYSAMERGVHDYLIKSDWSLEDIVDKIKEKL